MIEVNQRQWAAALFRRVQARMKERGVRWYQISMVWMQAMFTIPEDRRVEVSDPVLHHYHR